MRKTGDTATNRIRIAVSKFFIKNAPSLDLLNNNIKLIYKRYNIYFNKDIKKIILKKPGITLFAFLPVGGVSLLDAYSGDSGFTSPAARY